MTFSKLKLRAAVIGFILLECFFPIRFIKASSFFVSNQDGAATLFSEAFQFYKRRQYSEAEKKLANLVQLDPLYQDNEEGSVWFWLGKVAYAQKKEEPALQIYLSGLEKLKENSLFDPFLGEAFMQLVIQLEKKTYYEQVSETFYQLLETEPREELLNRLYEQCVFLFSEREQSEAEQFLKSNQSSANVSRILLKFWRASDPTPATILNERLIEHLQRVEYATKHYPAGLVRGFDDRGMIYVKLGTPSGVASAGVTATDARRNYNFLPHEVWFYEFIAPELHFPFVHLQDKRAYVLVDGIEKAITGGGVSSLWRTYIKREEVPSSEGSYRGINQETPELDRRLLFYKRLAVSSSIFYNRVLQLEDILTKMAADDSPKPLSYWNKFAVDRMTFLDQEAASFRSRTTPEVLGDPLPDIEPLPIFVRTARFLEEDGRTRLEVYLGLLKNDLGLKPSAPQLQLDTLFVKIAAAVEDTSLRPTSTAHRQLVVFDEGGEPPPNNQSAGRHLLLEQLALNTELSDFFVSGQVESWLATLDRGLTSQDSLTPILNLRSQAMIKLGAFRTEQQKAFRFESGSLLLSDLQLSSQIIPAADHPTPNKGELYVAPYPFQRVDRQKQLFIYFEIYGLRLSPEATTRYRIGYEAAELKSKQSLAARIKSLLGGRERSEVALESEYEGASANSREWIALDLSALSPGEITLTVTVKDLISGESTKRAIVIELI
jgi:GWxTD domain-containing protein